MIPHYITLVKRWGAIISQKITVKIYAKDYKDAIEIAKERYDEYELKGGETEKTRKLINPVVEINLIKVRYKWN